MMMIKEVASKYLFRDMKDQDDLTLLEMLLLFCDSLRVCCRSRRLGTGDSEMTEQKLKDYDLGVYMMRTRV